MCCEPLVSRGAAGMRHGRRRSPDFPHRGGGRSQPEHPFRREEFVRACVRHPHLSRDAVAFSRMGRFSKVPWSSSHAERSLPGAKRIGARIASTPRIRRSPCGRAPPPLPGLIVAVSDFSGLTELSLVLSQRRSHGSARLPVLWCRQLLGVAARLLSDPRKDASPARAGHPEIRVRHDAQRDDPC